MEFNFFKRLQNGWNAFKTLDMAPFQNRGVSQSYRPDTPRVIFPGSDKTIYTSILTRIAIDVAQLDYKHCRVDIDDRFIDEEDSSLNECLQVSANIDQTGRALIQDAVMTMLLEGHCAIVPTDLKVDPRKSANLSVEALRVGRVVEWKPQWVRVDLYNERKGIHEQVMLPKRIVAVVQNPLYPVMNAPSSTLQRLVRMLNTMDAIGDKLGSKKLDLIIQLPYAMRSSNKQDTAKRRREELQEQLGNSEYGIAYADAVEKIVQLNRPVESNVQPNVDYLTKTLYGQLGMTEEVMNGIADEQVMLNYQNRTVEPIATALCEEMTRKFITPEARARGQCVKFFKNPFRLVAVNQIADIADKFTRNEILSPNEMRSFIGVRPSDSPNADELRNRNIAMSAEQMQGAAVDDMGNPIPVNQNVPPVQ